MKDTRRYYADENGSVRDRGRKVASLGGADMLVAACCSRTVAKMVAACLNLYERNPKFRLAANAAEKQGVTQNGNSNDGTTQSSQPANAR